MPAWLNGALRAALQVGWAWLAAFALARFGIHLPAHEPAAVDAVASALVLGAIVAAVQWAERQPPTSLVNRVARIVMLSLRPAAYPKPEVPTST
jgi:hypothetical protein